MMTFPTIAAGTRANEAIGGYANFVAYCNALAAGVDSVTTTAAGAALKANNLSDLASASTARTNLGLGTMATATASDYLSKAGNLSGIADPAAARTNLSLGDAATRDVGTTAGTVAAGDDSRLTGALQASGNLAAIADAAVARTNLGLGTMATAAASDYLSKAGNLSGIADPAAARTNLGLGTMATASASAYALLTGATFTGDVTFGTTSGIRLGYGGRFYDPDATRTVLLANGNKFDVLDETGGSYLFQAGGNGVGFIATNGLTANANAASVVPIKARMAAAQTANGFEAQNSSGSVLASISANGTGTFAGVACGSFTNGATNPYLHLNSNRNGVGVINRNVISQIPFHVQGMAGQTGNLTNWLDGSAVTLASITAAGLHRWDAAANQQTTVGAAGGASALPATPTKYLKVVDSTGATLVIPAYAAA